MGWLSRLRSKKRGKVHIIEGPQITKTRIKLRNEGVHIKKVGPLKLPPLGKIASLRGKREQFENFRKFAKQKHLETGHESSAVGLLIKEEEGKFRVLQLENLTQVEKSSAIRISHDSTIFKKLEKMEKEIKKQNPDAELRILNIHSHPPGYALAPSLIDLKSGLQQIGTESGMGRPIMGIMNPLTGEINFYEGERKIPFKDK